MIDKITHIEAFGREYPMVLNLNVMEALQEKYGSFEAWGEAIDGDGEPRIKELKFGFMAMINEGIELENDINGTDRQLVTEKQVGRIISAVSNAQSIMRQLIVDSTKGAEPKEKNM